jgi:hypothetical protein
MLHSERIQIAHELLKTPGAIARIYPDGSLNKAALKRELARANLSAQVAFEAQHVPMNHTDKGKMGNGLKSPTPGKYSGHRHTPCGWQHEGR